MSTPQPRSLSSAEVPHVHFMPYNREESIEILCKTPLPIKRLTMAEGEDSGDEDLTEEDIKEDRYVWQKFCAAIWDSLAKGAARNVVQFRAIVEKNWLPFVQPIVEREFGTRNFSSLYLFHKDMFRRENTVIDTVIPSSLEQKFSIGKCEFFSSPYSIVGLY
jgi:origin recognition complex subunit 5